jgi:hypothetical protein
MPLLLGGVYASCYLEANFTPTIQSFVIEEYEYISMLKFDELFLRGDLVVNCESQDITVCSNSDMLQ